MITGQSYLWGFITVYRQSQSNSCRPTEWPQNSTPAMEKPMSGAKGRHWGRSCKKRPPTGVISFCVHSLPRFFKWRRPCLHRIMRKVRAMGCFALIGSFPEDGPGVKKRKITKKGVGGSSLAPWAYSPTKNRRVCKNAHVTQSATSPDVFHASSRRGALRAA
jgi:hypothetical protein